MFRKVTLITCAVLIALIAVLSATGIASQSAAAYSSGITRLGGNDRVETSAAICAEGWDSAKNMVICNGFSFADAMVGVPLAAKLNAPVLLTRGDLPEEAIISTIQNAGTKHVCIMGGEGAVSTVFVQELEKLGCSVERISGTNRYTTAANAAEYLTVRLGTKPKQVFIVSGESFPEALAVSHVTGATVSPMLYSCADGTLVGETVSFIRNSGISKAVIVGDMAAVPESVEISLREAGITEIKRISGDDRYQTSLMVNQEFDSALKGRGVALACGENFPDALAGGAFAAKYSIPMLLINNTSSVPGAYEYLKSRGMGRIYVFGMEGSLSDYALNTFISGGTMTTESTTATTTTTTTTTATTAPTKPGATDKMLTPFETINVRSGVGTSNSKLGLIGSGSYYTIFGSEKDQDGIDWYKIEYNDGFGWVCGSYVTVCDASAVHEKAAYLTFDDGPSDNTKQILDILDKYGVKATFFVIHQKGYEDVYKDIVQRGHTIALHSYTHDYAKIYRSTSAYFEDLDKLSDYVYELTGVRSKVLRFPGGSSNTVSRSYCSGIMSTLTKEVRNRGYEYYDWNVDSGDASGNSIPSDRLVANVRTNCGEGSLRNVMILMHDASVKKTTVEALPQIITTLQSLGYTILPITEDTAPMHHGVNN